MKARLVIEDAGISMLAARGYVDERWRCTAQQQISRSR